MPRQKKIQQYVLNIKLPASGRETALIENKPDYQDFFHCYSLYKTVKEQHSNNYRGDYFSGWNEKFTTGECDPSNWKELCGKYTVRNLHNNIFPVTPEFSELNKQFFDEYDSRADLQELYKEVSNEGYYFYDRFGNYFTKDSEDGKKFIERPDNFMMYRDVIKGSATAGKKMELARETPYQEGDLVLLRDPFIGDRRRDPLYSNEWDDVTGQRIPTPGPEVQRIGTVIAVTDRVDRYRTTKGSKIIQLIWNCKAEPTLSNVEEKYIKWHMRPTYKNGLKVRPQ